jgi:PAS domain-containing protein
MADTHGAKSRAAGKSTAGKASEPPQAESLQQGERFLEDVFASIQDGVSVLDTDLNIVRVNPSMERWYEKNMPLVGRKCYEAYHNRTTACENCPSVRALNSGHTEREIVAGLPGSSAEWLELYSFPGRGGARASGGAAASVGEDAGYRPTGRWHRARLQQPAYRHHGLRRHAAHESHS